MGSDCVSIYIPMNHLMSHLSEPQVPQGLLSRILQAIDNARIRRLRFGLVSLSGAALTSIGLIVWSRAALLTEVGTSSFGEFVRLALTDPDIVFQNLGSYLNGLLENLPLESLLLGLTAVFMLGAVIRISQALYQASRPHVHLFT